jgi:hypothetical protein
MSFEEHIYDFLAHLSRYGFKIESLGLDKDNFRKLLTEISRWQDPLTGTITIHTPYGHVLIYEKE